MKVMILAAGRGERMGELTRDIPKPLIRVRGKPLIEWHLEKLSTAGFKDIIINVCYLSKIIKDFVGDGSKWQLKVAYSEESPILETAGGINNALKLLGKDSFAVINADIFTNFDYAKLKLINLNNNSDGYLVLVKNPEHNHAGDFGLLANNCLTLNSVTLHTFSGMAVYHPRFFKELEMGIKMQLLPLLKKSIPNSLIKGELFEGIWSDIGTPQRLKAINKTD
jgi:MurNAc alpha-1-phosphate uridylyltransferase